MSLDICSICKRAVSETAERCACGAQLDWLRAAPEILRGKLGNAKRAALGAVVLSAVSGCGSCAAIAESDCAAFVDSGITESDCGVGLDAFRTSIDSGITESDCGLDAYVDPDSNVQDASLSPVADAGCDVDAPADDDAP